MSWPRSNLIEITKYIDKMSVYKFVLPTLAIAAQAVDFSPFPYPGTSGLGIAERQTDPLVQCLQNGASPTAAVETQGQTNFLNDSVRYATIDAPSYKVVMRASSVEDIANSVSDPGHDHATRANSV